MYGLNRLFIWFESFVYIVQIVRLLYRLNRSFKSFGLYSLNRFYLIFFCRPYKKPWTIQRKNKKCSTELQHLDTKTVKKYSKRKVLYQKMAALTLEDALSVQTDNAFLMLYVSVV